jgi:outer membrane biogenesis lipoprotein LolB
MAVPEQKKTKPARPGAAAAGVVLLAISALISCFPTRPSFSPLPPHVESIEGYASLRLTRDGETVKSRFSFLFLLPGQGRIDIFDPLGRTVSSLFIEADEAFFVLPSKKIYWETTREEALSRFLGFALAPQEMTAILSGKPEDLRGWELLRDSRDRVYRGLRGDIQFEVRQFFDGSRLPQLLALAHGGDRGSLRILRLNFNEPLKKNAFRLSFLQDEKYTATTWAGIEKWLRHED